jgi:dynamin 1-like protein
MNDLLNKTYPLLLGYFGVICRSPKDIENNKSIESQIENEKKFFESHKDFSKYSSRLGVPFLINNLKIYFTNQIKKSLPNIKEKLIEIKMGLHQDLNQYGNYEAWKDPHVKGTYMLALINKFCKNFSEILSNKKILKKYFY